MPYTVVIRREADRTLRRLDRATRARIAEKIVALGDDPGDPALDVRPLQGEARFRLRVGGWRIIFERQDAVRVISVERIGTRGDVYK